MVQDDGDHLLFVYGSLMHEPSLLRTLAHRRLPPTGAPFEVRDWERAWDCVSRRTFTLAGATDGVVHRRVVLGLRPRAGAACEGVVFHLDARDLAALGQRELAYELVELEHAGAFDRLIVTFVPLRSRTIERSNSVEPLVIEQAYLDECRSGAVAHGLNDAQRDLETVPSGLPVVAAANPT